MKTFKQLLIESEKEYCYIVKSTENIQTEERMELIKQAAIPHRFRSIAVAGYKAPMIANPDFPEAPYSPSYAVRVYTGLWVCPEVFEEEVKARLNFMPSRNYRGTTSVAYEGDDAPEKEEKYLGNEPYSDAANLLKNPKFKQVADSVNDVGESRVKSIMQELQADKKARQKIIDDKKKAKFIYETICVPYTGINKIINEGVRKGFYMVHLHGKDLVESIQVEGPFNEVLAGLDYHEEIFENDVIAKIDKKKIDENNLDIFEISIEGK